MILYVNACIRKESRTKKLADHLISRLDDTVTEVKLKDIRFPQYNEEFLNKREELICKKQIDDPMFILARQFAEADTIVIAAPCWNESFPALLKQYLDEITIPGITYRYNEVGTKSGLCKAKRCFYVTTAGRVIFTKAYGYGYIHFLTMYVFGIKVVKRFSAEGLDWEDSDVERIMQRACDYIDSELKNRGWASDYYLPPDL